jgi:hypothetical protein
MPRPGKSDNPNMKCLWGLGVDQVPFDKSFREVCSGSHTQTRKYPAKLERNPIHDLAALTRAGVPYWAGTESGFRSSWSWRAENLRDRR